MSAPIMTTGERLLAAALQEPATNPDVNTGLAKLDELRPGYIKADQYFEDTAPEFFASARLRRAMAATGKAFKINFAAVPVKAAAQRIKVASTTCPGNDEATAWIARQWRRNQLDLYMPDVILRACEFGDAYLITWPADPEEDDDEYDDDLEDDDDAIGELDAPTGTNNQRAAVGGEFRPDMDIHLNLGLTTAVVYAEENPRHARFVVRRWDAGDHVRVDLHYRNRIEKYATKPGVKAARDAADLVRFRDEPDDEWPYPNPYRQLPGHHFRTARPYGRPLHKPFYGPQDAIRKLIVSHMATVDYQAFMQRYALMHGNDTSDAAAVDEDEFAFDDETTGATRTRGGSADSQLEADPGSVWFMRGVREVGTFPESDPEQFLGPVDRYLLFGAQVCETPMRFFDYARGQVPSGVAQDAADAPFISKVNDLIASFRATLQDLWQCALAMAGFGKDIPVTVTFAPPERVTGLDGWRVVELKIKLGMSPRQAFMEAGYTPEQVLAMFPTGVDVEQRLAVLKAVAEALQMLGAAASLEVLEPGQITDLIAAVLPDVTAAVSAPEQQGDDG